MVLLIRLHKHLLPPQSLEGAQSYAKGSRINLLHFFVVRALAISPYNKKCSLNGIIAYYIKHKKISIKLFAINWKFNIQN